MQVLVVDDDEHIRTALRRCLALGGYSVELAATAGDALERLRGASPDAIVLDWELPDLSGIELCRRLRAAGDHVPVLMLTARGEVGDRVEGLDAGADDFLAKPFELDELLARVRALLRRGALSVATAGAPAIEAKVDGPPLVVGDVVLDRAAHLVRRGERSLELTRTEFTLLQLLMRNAGVVLERGTIMREVWDYDFGGSNANLDVYVSYLRRKLEAGGEPRMLETVRGVGFVLRAAT